MAVDEGAKYHFLTQPVRFIAGADGKLAQIECVRTVLGEPDSSGRRAFSVVEGSDFILNADTALMAIGYKPDPSIGSTTPGIKPAPRPVAADQHTGHASKGLFRRRRGHESAPGRHGHGRTQVRRGHRPLSRLVDS
jgi:glutamate synthase (NADPH/NADH) small chain